MVSTDRTLLILAGAAALVCSGVLTAEIAGERTTGVRRPLLLSGAVQSSDSARQVARALALVRANGNSVPLNLTSFQRRASRITIDFAPVDNQSFGGEATVEIYPEKGTICVRQFE
jgi:hypothetical protein